jgi:hypothetical protein
MVASSLLTFLASLPAILGIAGLVIVQLIRSQGRAAKITEQIVAKLRQESPQTAASIEGLSPRQLAKKAELETDFRKLLSTQDFELLKRVTDQQFIISLVVYVLVALMFLASLAGFVFLQTRPQPVSLGNWNLQSNDQAAGGLAVDLDDLLLTWQADGPATDLNICLENIQSLQRTGDYRVSSSEQRLIIPRSALLPLLQIRDRGGINRLRILARTGNASFASREFPLRVGIKVEALLDAERSQIMLYALIDNSIIQGYDFEAKVVAWRTPASEGPEAFGGTIRNSRTDFPVQNLSALRWDTAKLTYLGPDDQRVVRCSVQ